MKISPGFSLTSRRRSTLAVARPLLLPPLLLTSTSLCRKVDRVTRQTLRPNVVKDPQKSGPQLLRNLGGKERGTRQGTRGTQRHGVPRAKSSLGEETWVEAAAPPRTTYPKMPQGLRRCGVGVAWGGSGSQLEVLLSAASERPVSVFVL